MCIKSKDGDRIITSRAFKYASASRYWKYNADKNYDRELVINLVNNSGTFLIELENLSTKEKEILDNPATGKYRLLLKKDISYSFVIRLRSAIGSYVIKIHKMEKES